MKSILNNPYRVAGIFANASAREIQSRKGKISAYAKVGKPITSEYDFPFLTPLERINTVIDKAFSDIEQNQNQVTHSLFWFININPVDNIAIQNLISGNKAKAIEIWEKLTDNKAVNSTNFSAFNNIGTLYLLENSKEKIKQGITTKIKLIESENFKDYVHAVADETFSIDKSKQIAILIDELLTQLKNTYSTSEIIELFSNCNGTTQTYLSKKFTEEPIYKIETQIEQCNKLRKKEEINTYKFGTDLHKNTKNELILLKSILGVENLRYKLLADKVAKEILQCSVDYFNASQKQEESGNYLEKAMELAKLAESIALDGATKSKVKENISTLEGMKDRELNQAIALLQSIKDAYEHARKTIDREVSSISLGYNQSINWSEVEKMKRNALDWEKVVKLIKEAIPMRNVEKIKNSDKQTKIKEYKSLVDFIFEKLSYSQKNQIKYLDYRKAGTTVENVQLTAKSIPLWAKWVVGIIVGIITFLLLVYANKETLAEKTEEQVVEEVVGYLVIVVGVLSGVVVGILSGVVRVVRVVGLGLGVVGLVGVLVGVLVGLVGVLVVLAVVGVAYVVVGGLVGLVVAFVVGLVVGEVVGALYKGLRALLKY